jgi:hypothetical protein
VAGRRDVPVQHADQILPVSAPSTHPGVNVFHEGHVEAQGGHAPQALVALNAPQTVVEGEYAKRQDVVRLNCKY